MSTTTDESTPSHPVPGHTTKHPGNGAVPHDVGLESEAHDQQITEPEPAVLPIRSVKPTAGPQETLDDISSLTVSSEDSVLTGAREVLTKVAVRKPKKDEFFRTHPSAYKGPYIVYEIKAQMETETYLITPKVWNALGPDLLAGLVKKVVLRVTMARSGLLFLHPIVEPDPLRKSNDYNESAREASLQAVNTWVRMQADTSKGHYRVWVAEGDLGVPKWPDFDVKEMINVAFKGKVISDPTHEIIETLRGKV